MAAANVFFDTEFGGFAPDEMQLISIGFVSENNRTLYLELDKVDPRGYSQFCKEVVLPLLDGGPKVAWDDAAARVRDYLCSFGSVVNLWTDSPGYDGTFLAELVASVRAELPEIRICVPEFDGFFARMNYVNRSEALFESRQLRRHHALDDAKAMREGWLAVKRSKPGQIDSVTDDADALGDCRFPPA